MPARDIDAVFYSGDVPGIEYRDGMFHVCYNIRSCYFEFVLPPPVFVKALLAAEEARAMWQYETIDGNNVTPIGKRKR